MKTILLFMFFILASSSNDDKTSSSCQDLLPLETTTGINTFGCYINGNLLIPCDGSGTLGGSDDELSKYGGYLNVIDYNEIEAIDFKGERTSKILLHIHQVYINGIGDYIVNESNGYNAIDGLNHTYCIVEFLTQQPTAINITVLQKIREL